MASSVEIVREIRGRVSGGESGMMSWPGVDGARELRTGRWGW